MTLTPGALIGHYRVLSLLGRGGMGEVYAAEDQTLRRRVALKLVPPQLAVNADALERFRREARAAATITDPHVVTVHSIEESGGIHFLTMELVEGRALQEVLLAGVLPLARSIQLMIGICDGVASAHDKGIVHRDLKPGNIMVTAGDRVKVLDFGLARLRETGGGYDASSPDGPALTVAALTEAQQIIGTTAYMSPEQSVGAPVDHRSDIFSLGTILYELVAGERPFKGDTPLALLTAIARDMPRPLSEATPTLPRDVWRITRRALEKEPVGRYQSARDLSHDLRDLLQQLSDGDRNVAVEAATTSPRPTWWPAAVPWLVVAGLLVLLAMAWAPSGSATTPARGSALRVSLTPPPNAVLPLTVGSLGAALSPDGRSVAYSAAAGDGRAILWVRSLDSPDSRKVADSPSATGWLFWSPDSKNLGYAADGKLRALDIDTGRGHVIGDAPGFRGAAWGGDGTILFAPSETSGLFRISASGGAPTAVTTLDASRGETSHRMPSFLPDGQHFIYRVQAPSDDVAGIYLGSLDGQVKRRLLAADSQGIYAPEGFLLFVVRGTLFAQRFDPGTATLADAPVPLATGVGYSTETGTGAFSVSSTGAIAHRLGPQGVPTNTLQWFSRGGRPLETLPLPPGYYGASDRSKSGKLALYRRDSAGYDDIWVVDGVDARPRRITFGPPQSTAPAWSPDERTLLFFSGRRGPGALMLTGAAGEGDERVLFESQDRVFPGGWSPDGRRVVFAARSAETQWDLFTIDVGETTHVRPYVVSRFNEQHAQFSPDGRWIAYTSDDSGGNEVYVRAYPPSNAPAVRVSPAGGVLPRWRADGRELYYFRPDRMLMAVPVTPAAQVSVGAAEPLFIAPRQALFLNPSGQSAGYVPSADGQRFLISNTPNEASQAIDLILNWPALLKRP